MVNVGKYTSPMDCLGVFGKSDRTINHIHQGTVNNISMVQLKSMFSNDDAFDF